MKIGTGSKTPPLAKATATMSLALVPAACTLSEPRPTEPVTRAPDDVSVTLDPELYLHMATSRVWGFPYIPRISAAITVDGDQVTFVQMSKVVSKFGSERATGDLSAITMTEIQGLMPRIRSAANQELPITPVLIIPTHSASMVSLRQIFDGGSAGYNPDAPVLVAWANYGTRQSVADIWMSVSTEGAPPLLGIEREFYEKAWEAEHAIVIIGPAHAIECQASEKGIGPCEPVEGLSKVTRIGLCGFQTWGEALATLETRVSRVTEVALLRDCSILARHVVDLNVSKRGSE